MPTQDNTVKIIKPTVGRVVHYWSPGATEPCAAIIAKVHSDRLINIALFDPNGCVFGLTLVELIQPGDEIPNKCHCRWPDYHTEPRAVQSSSELEKIKEEYLKRAAAVQKGQPLP